MKRKPYKQYSREFKVEKTGSENGVRKRKTGVTENAENGGQGKRGSGLAFCPPS